MRITACPKDPLHDAGARRCKTCKSIVKTACVHCQKLVSSSGIAFHEANCREKTTTPPPNKIPVAYVMSNRAQKRGTVFYDEEQCPLSEASPWLVSQAEHSGGDGCTVDVYDAIVAHLDAPAGPWQVVATLSDIGQVQHIVRKRRSVLLDAARVLIWPNWLFESTDATSLDSVLAWVEQMRQFECATGCLVFPPIDYSLHFGRKELWMSYAMQRGVPVIPTFFLFNGDMSDVGEFVNADKEKGRVVMKRTLSDECRHVHEDVMLVGKGKRRKIKKGTAPGLGERELAAFPYLVQPFLSAFEEEPEYRIYIVHKDKFLFGIQSSWDKNEGQLQYSHVRELPQGAVETALNAVRQLPAQYRWFVRVDLVWSQTEWLVNEMEHFGNTHILLPMVQGQELMQEMATVVGEWISELV